MQSIKLIQAGAHQSWANYWQRVWQNRDLILTLARRDIKIKYAQSVLGVFWVLIQPMLGVALFTLVVSKWFNVSIANYPYPLFAFSGLAVWNFFSYMVSGGGTSLSSSRELIQRLSFPRIVLPVSKIAVGLFDWLISLLVLLLMVPFFNANFHLHILLLPVFVLGLMLAGFALAVWLSALTIRFRDFHHLIPYLVNFGIWVTPVFYSIEIVPQNFRWIIQLNPVAFALEGLRWCLFNAPFNALDFLPSLLITLTLLVSGMFYFRSVEKNIADTI